MRLSQGAGLREIYEDIEGPIIVRFGIDDGLLDQPRFFDLRQV